jgi:hypothetical protein
LPASLRGLQMRRQLRAALFDIGEGVAHIAAVHDGLRTAPTAARIFSASSGSSTSRAAPRKFRTHVPGGTGPVSDRSIADGVAPVLGQAAQPLHLDDAGRGCRCTWA